MKPGDHVRVNSSWSFRREQLARVERVDGNNIWVKFDDDGREFKFDRQNLIVLAPNAAFTKPDDGEDCR